MHQVFVESITWKRINLTLLGRVERSSSPEAAPLERFFLQNPQTAEQVALVRPVWDGAQFSVTFNVMQACAQYPLAAGDWQLFYEVPASDPVAVRIDPSLAVTASDYGGLFSGPTYQYWVVPGKVAQGDSFRLAVSTCNGAVEPNADAGRVWRDLKRAMRHLRAGVYVALFNAIRRLVRKNGRRILFTSDSRSEMSGNLHHIHDRMLERGLDLRYQIRTSFKSSITARRPFLDKLLFPYRLAVADVVILDDYHPMLYKVGFDPDVTVVQVWHASGAFKTVGYSRVGKPGGPSPFSAAHKNYTYAIVGSKHDVPFYAEAFGLPENRVIPTGIPRMDMFFDEECKAARRELVHEALPLTRGKRVFLFAPTFRGSGPSSAYYDYDQLDLSAFHALCEELDAVCVFKMHPFVISPLEIPEEFSDRFIDATKSREISDLLLVADLVITDYSSLVFEYSSLNRPMLFFAYDLDEYISTRDFYEEFADFVPGRIVRTFAEMLEAIRDGEFEWEKVRPFAETHLGHLDAGSTDRVIDQLVLRTANP